MVASFASTNPSLAVACCSAAETIGTRQSCAVFTQPGLLHTVPANWHCFPYTELAQTAPCSHLAHVLSSVAHICLSLTATHAPTASTAGCADIGTPETTPGRVLSPLAAQCRHHTSSFACTCPHDLQASDTHTSP